MPPVVILGTDDSARREPRIADEIVRSVLQRRACPVEQAQAMYALLSGQTVCEP